jgi:hypothetical protein
MTDRLLYTLRHALRLKFGLWPTEAEFQAFVEYLACQKITIEEMGE